MLYTLIVGYFWPNFTALYFFFSPFVFLFFIENLEQFRKLGDKVTPLLTSLIFRERGNKLALMRRQVQMEVRSVALDLEWGSMGSLRGSVSYASTSASASAVGGGGGGLSDLAGKTSLGTDLAARQVEKASELAAATEAEEDAALQMDD